MRAPVAVAIAVITTLAAAGPALAQPGLTPRRAPPRVTATPAAPKSGGAAVIMSVLGTLVPAAMFAGAGSQGMAVIGSLGIAVGPSAGHWYAGKTVTWGMGVRAIGAVALIAGLAAALGDDCEGPDGLPDPACESNASDGRSMVLAGAGLVLSGAILDIATAPGAVDAWNREYAPRVAPTAMRVGSAWGVGLTGTF